jgi:hypothetical protein
MSKHSTRHAGFGAVGVVLIIVLILGVAGGVGLFVSNRHTKNSACHCIAHANCDASEG